MKPTTMNFGISSAVIVVLLALAAFVGFATLIARADTAPAITQSIQNNSNATVTSAPIGSSVRDIVTIASSTSSTAPTGTVDFNLYAGTLCGGTPAVQSAVALVSGIATSSSTIVPAGGLSYNVHYSGDASTTATNSSCQSVAATASSVSISNALSQNNVLSGSTVYDTSLLSNATANATGTVSYNIYTNNLCTNLSQAAGVKTVANASAPNSDAIFFTTGSYWWQAAYSGDQFNSPAISSCIPLTVVATSTPVTPPATSTPGTISGNVFNDLNKSGVKDSSEVGIAGFTIDLHLGAKKDGYNNPVVATAVTDGNGNYSFANLALGTYFVEEMPLSGYKQTSGDKKVVLGASNTGSIVNFANIAKAATSTPGNSHHCDGDHDADDVGCTATTTQQHDNGNHFGWLKNFKFNWNFNFGHSGKDK